MKVIIGILIISMLYVAAGLLDNGIKEASNNPEKVQLSAIYQVK